MPRIARMIIKGEPAVYRVISRTALDGYVIGDVEKWKKGDRRIIVFDTMAAGTCGRT